MFKKFIKLYKTEDLECIHLKVRISALEKAEKVYSHLLRVKNSKSKEWIVKTAQKLSRIVAEYVSKIGAFLKKVLDKGFSYLLQFLGFEPVSLEIKV